MESIREKMQALEAKAEESKQELTALHAACDDYKVKNESLNAQVEESKKALAAAQAAAQESTDNFESEMQAKDKDLAEAHAEIETLKAKLEMTPAARDAVNGQSAVNDGTPASNEIDHKAELDKLPLGSAQAIAYYREHKDEIDA